jgi:hypothetical protein
LHISSGFDFGLQFFSQLHFCCVALRICVWSSWLAPNYRYSLRFPLQMAIYLA